jgi:hypothetical protein
MQMICALLVLQTADLPAPLTTLSPWLDMRLCPAKEDHLHPRRTALRRCADDDVTGPEWEVVPSTATGEPVQVDGTASHDSILPGSGVPVVNTCFVRLVGRCQGWTSEPFSVL